MNKNQQPSVCEDKIVEIERVPRHIASATLKKDRSLKPGVAVMEAAAEGQPEACAIRDSWRFQFPVHTVTIERHQCMIERNQVTFHG